LIRDIFTKPKHLCHKKRERWWKRKRKGRNK